MKQWRYSGGGDNDANRLPILSDCESLNLHYFSFVWRFNRKCVSQWLHVRVFACWKLRDNAPILIILRTKMIFLWGGGPALSSTPHPSRCLRRLAPLLKSEIRHWYEVCRLHRNVSLAVTELRSEISCFVPPQQGEVYLSCKTFGVISVVRARVGSRRTNNVTSSLAACDVRAPFSAKIPHWKPS